jgi:hypothetical protein
MNSQEEMREHRSPVPASSLGLLIIDKKWIHVEEQAKKEVAIKIAAQENFDLKAFICSTDIFIIFVRFDKND